MSTNVFYDVWPPLDDECGDNDIIQDCGQDGYCWDYEALNQNSPQHAKDIWGNYAYNIDGDPIIIDGPDNCEGDGIYSCP